MKRIILSAAIFFLLSPYAFVMAAPASQWIPCNDPNVKYFTCIDTNRACFQYDANVTKNPDFVAGGATTPESTCTIINMQLLSCSSGQGTPSECASWQKAIAAEQATAGGCCIRKDSSGKVLTCKDITGFQKTVCDTQNLASDLINWGITGMITDKTNSTAAGCATVEGCPQFTGTPGATGGTTDPLKDLVIKKPLLGITIPGLNLTDVNKVDAEGYLYIPWIAEYMSALYKFAIGVVSIVAVVMIIYHGARIATSGGGSAQAEGYKGIFRAVIGLLIAWGSYAILYTVNPNLVQFNALKVKYVQTVPLENLVMLSDSDYQKITGQGRLPPAVVMQKAKDAATQVGLDDPCYVITIIGKESGGNPGAIGHDENYPRPTCVWSRKLFLTSGVKYSKTPFTPPSSVADYNCARDNGTKDANGKSLVNDDKFNPDAPPDYGLDWRFSHGFGLGQATLKDSSKCGGQRGLSMFGKCFTIPELLTVDSAAFFAANLFKSNLDCAVKKGWNTGDQKIQAAYWAYAAGCGNVSKNNGQDISSAPGVPRAWAAYQACKASPKQFSTPDPETVATPDAAQ